ncbi:MAG: sulfatase-like hydrolase/transferase, partial [Verrucomicrobiota bacterium]
MKFSVLFLFFSTVGLAVERPNVLFIAVDDLRPDLACYGNEQIVSPHIDRLAERGTLFERAYCQQAVCSPSRVSLMTGLRPDTTKVMNLETDFRDTIPEAVTLSQFFISKGYYAASIGKIYHGNMLDEEFSWSVPHVRGNAPTYANKASNDIVRRLREKAVAEGLKGAALRKASLGPAFEAGEVEDEFYRDGANALEAVKRLESLAESGEPFFLAFGLSKPHLPFVSPKRYWDLYDREKLQ